MKPIYKMSSNSEAVVIILMVIFNLSDLVMIKEIKQYLGNIKLPWEDNNK